ncbi:eukaryotic translation initiation factor 4E binding protein-domain-containing protein [Syncephalis pseudoplumigaleata]|uniref:Eukaryotic translation initiation factor 4E binding protein-domain-containing protein n=1 Tax=Syncephalis pseudoplumigaleata TaxID=1712513 RepID=A0A4P9Z2V4_9FUNG|nr:eukaryotic translation initiation factor 4E binding protein-domain-containing protein [Syncephalis pseudoplumigaleata]|eukprot:RKP26746.1 eukaryotic translation initiation factor 4E binding protein-domain-containing protein [Syncephalis pseudoplumigaleata]
MSTSARDIPVAIRRADPGAPLPSDYSTTPHGTIFSTTPGGTRIIYDRNKLLSLRNSPLSRTPPANMANIPGVTRASYTCPSGSLPVHPSSLSRSVSASDVADTEALSGLRNQALPATREEEDDADAGTFNGTAADGSAKNKGEDLFDMEME